MQKYLFIVIYLLFGWSLMAQTPFLRRYTVDDGLPSSNIYRAFQDSEGFIWICTDRGLSRFDGYRFENFTTKNGLPYNDIWDIVEDKNKRLWLASYAFAISYYDMKKQSFEVTYTSKLPAYSNQKIAGYFFNSKDDVSVFTNPILKFNPLSKTINPTTLPIIDFYATIKKGSNYIEPFSLPDVFPYNYRYMVGRKPYFPSEVIRSKMPIINIIFINEKQTFYSNKTELHFLSNNTDRGVNINTLSKFPNSEVVRIDRFGEESLLVFATNEVFMVDKNLQRLHQFDYLNDYKINSVFFDKESNLWLCTKDKGLLLLTKEAQNSFVISNLDNYAIKCMAYDKTNLLWLGTNTGDIYTILQNKATKVNLNNISKVPVRNIATTSNNEIMVIWESGDLGIFPANIAYSTHTLYPKIFKFKVDEDRKKTFFQLENNRKYHENHGLIIKSIPSKRVIENNGSLLIGLSYGMRKVVVNKNVLTLETMLYNVRSLAMVGDTENLWIGSSNGLWLAKKENFNSKIGKKIKAINATINDLVMDDKGYVWAGTDGYGVIRYKNDKVLNINELTGKIVNSLFFEKTKKRIWAATNEGVYAITDNGNDNYDVNKISLTQGLPTLEVHTVFAKEDKLYAGTNNSLAVIDLKTFFEKENKKKEKTSLVIKSIKINGKDTTRLQNYDLSYTKNSIEIDFVELSFKSDKNIQYEYKLATEDANNQWQTTNETRLSFAFLSPGKYEFFLKAFDIEGNETSLEIPIRFVINPPYWQTWWFRLMLSLLLLGAITYAFILYRKRAEKEVEISKKFAELELQALQSQMNPHFVFNALSSIQSFILNKDTNAANEYLTNFSKLIRLFLESSRNRYISIFDEKILLENYIQLEQARFKNKFSYEIRENNFIEPTFEIPSMLIQPFVENAINHGLVYKETKGYLLVSFEKIDDTLICIVEDDGIGRLKAKEIRTKSLKAYKSRATEIIDERLKTLKIVDGTEVEVNIIDIYHPNTGISGTKVEIKILIK